MAIGDNHKFELAEPQRVERQERGLIGDRIDSGVILLKLLKQIVFLFFEW